MSNPENIGINGNAIVEIHHIFWGAQVNGQIRERNKTTGGEFQGEEGIFFCTVSPFWVLSVLVFCIIYQIQ